ncbi:MAG: hypothetical protein RJB11_1382, partial [Planctomycetota bacterium]
GLVFEAYTDKIPKRFTPVRLVLVLSDEAPYAEDVSEKEKETKNTDAAQSEPELPKHLKAQVPKRLLEFLPPKKT